MNEVIEEYKMLVANGSEKLSKLVNEALDEGYELYGNPVLSQSYQGLDDAGAPKVKVFVGQAVVLPFEDSEEES